MAGVTFKELQSDKALVCKREINGEKGGATVWCVCLSDGFLIECGVRWGEERARILADIINAGGPEKLSEAALKSTAAKEGEKS